jgi:tetratricopeptide (TPR) repeat protein
LDLEARLLGEDSDELGQQAAKTLQAGDLALAGKLLDQLIAKREQVVDKLAANHFNRAVVFQLQYKPVQALPHLKKAYNYRAENRKYAFAYALLLAKQRQFKQAILIYEDILQYDRELGDDTDVAMTLNNLANLYSETNRYEPAEKHYLEALELYRKLVQANPKAYLFYVAGILNNLASLYSDTKRYELADKHHLEALELYRKLTQANPKAYLPDVAMTLNNLATLYSETNRYEPAEKHYLEAFKLYRKLTQANPKVYYFYMTITLNNLTTLYSDTKRYELAEKHYLEALDIRRKLAQTNPKFFKSILVDAVVSVGILSIFASKNKIEPRKYFNESL